MKKILIIIIPIFIITSIIVVYIAGSKLIKRRSVRQPLAQEDRATIIKSDQTTIFTTFYQGIKNRPIITLFHPLGGSQESMKSRLTYSP